MMRKWEIVRPESGEESGTDANLMPRQTASQSAQRMVVARHLDVQLSHGSSATKPPSTNSWLSKGAKKARQVSRISHLERGLW